MVLFDRSCMTSYYSKTKSVSYTLSETLPLVYKLLAKWPQFGHDSRQNSSMTSSSYY